MPDDRYLAGDRWGWGEDDPEEFAVDWDLRGSEEWARFADRTEVFRLARMKRLRSLLEGACLEGTWGLGGYETVVPDRRYL